MLVSANQLTNLPRAHLGETEELGISLAVKYAHTHTHTLHRHCTDATLWQLVMNSDVVAWNGKLLYSSVW